MVGKYPHQPQVHERTLLYSSYEGSLSVGGFIMRVVVI